WFPADRFPNLVAAYAETGSITSALRAEGANNYLRRWTRIHARAAEPEERDRLDLPAGASVLITDALNEDETGTPLHFTSARFAADRIEILIDSEPQETGADAGI
ncbi:MAG: UTRA domain-containing protein, partial [bacterium]|nr:UTRA domain-containing protein [bacterium]